jgi:hypothetical protein
MSKAPPAPALTIPLRPIILIVSVLMSLQEGPRKKRLKTGITRVRTGCYTCRQRKVKVRMDAGPLLGKESSMPGADAAISVSSVMKQSQDVKPVANWVFAARVMHHGISSLIRRPSRQFSGQQRCCRGQVLRLNNHRPPNYLEIPVGQHILQAQDSPLTPTVQIVSRLHQ